MQQTQLSSEELPVLMTSLGGDIMIDLNYGNDGQMILGDDGSVDTVEDVDEVVQQIKSALSSQVANYDWDLNYGIDRRVFYTNPIDEESVQTELTEMLDKIDGVESLISMSLGDVIDDPLLGKYITISMGLMILGQTVSVDVPVSLNGEDIDATNN